MFEVTELQLYIWVIIKWIECGLECAMFIVYLSLLLVSPAFFSCFDACLICVCRRQVVCCLTQ